MVESPGGDPPGAFVVEDIVVGKGREAKLGDAVEVQYVGVDYEFGEQFDGPAARHRPERTLIFVVDLLDARPG